MSRRSCRGSLRVAALLLLVLAPALPAGARPQIERAEQLGRIERSGRPEEERLVLSLLLGRRLLAEGLSGYLRADGGLLLSLGDLTAALDLAVTVDPAAGMADGWVIREGRRFALDLARGTVEVDGRTVPLETGPVELHGDGIYVDTLLLARWLPIDLKVDLRSLTLALTSREKLPIELELERQARWARMGEGSSGSGTDGEARRLPYSLLDWPALDAQANLLVSHTAAGDLVTVTPSLLAAGDLLAHNAELYLSGTAGTGESGGGRGLGTARLTLGRRDPMAELLGPLRATGYAFGDLASPTDPLVSRGLAGVGAEVSSFPLGTAALFDRMLLRGDALPGWDAELYRNDALIGFQTVGPDGRWEFGEVPLAFGRNVFRVVLYGPQGQRREVVERSFVGQGMPRPGEDRFRLGAYQQNGSLFATEGRRPLKTETETEPENRGLRLFGDYERGLTRRIAVRAGFASLPLDESEPAAGRPRFRRHDYGRLALRAAAAWGEAALEVVSDRAGGEAGQLELRSRLGRLGVFARQAVYRGLVSEQILGDSELRGLSELRLDGSLPLAGSRSLPFGLTLQREVRAGGDSSLHFEGRLSGRFHGLALTQWLALTEADGERQGTGSLLASGRLRDVVLRGNLGYDLLPARRLTQIALTAERDLRPDLRISLGLGQSLSGTGNLNLSAGLSWQLEPVLLSASLRMADDGSAQLGASVAFNLRRQPLAGPWRLRAGSAARQGAAAARVFLDRDQDGRFSPGDEPLPGVELLADGLPQEEATDARGLTDLTLAADRPVTLALDPDSLDDPSWIPARGPVRILPRGGKAWNVDFPVVATGEIDGTVRLGKMPLSNVRLQILDAGGNVVQEARSQYDGFYLFQAVLPGRYQLRIDPVQAARLRLLLPPPRDILLGPGEVRSGLDWSVERTPEGCGRAPGEAGG
jgi:hypothetical protein